MSDTSIEAYESMKPHLNRIRTMCLEKIIESGLEGMTAQEVENSLVMTRSTISTRMGELRRMGYIKYTGRKRKTTSGRNADVYVSTKEIKL